MAAACPLCGSAQALKEESIDTAAVVTAASGHKPIAGLLKGELSISPEGLGNLPKFMGVNDLFKTLQLMPGIQVSGEADAGIYIRGNDSGHNLVLLDGAPIYSPSHLMGFYSIFNGDHLAGADLYKSGISPEFGGRLGPVIDISSRTDIPETVTGSLNVGLISSQGTVGVPLGKKSAVYVSGRGTYMDYIISRLSVSGQFTPDYGFQDYNATWTYCPDEDNNIRLSMYYGKDRADFSYLSYQARAKMAWSNAAASLSWDSGLNGRADMRHAIFFSRNGNDFGIRQAGASMSLPSHLMDLGYRGSVGMNLPYGKLSAGIFYTFHDVAVQYPVIENLYGRDAPGVPEYRTHEFGAFAGYSADIVPGAVSADIGLRYSFCLQPLASGAPVFYSCPEPRVSLSWDAAPNLRVITSYSLQSQYVNQVAVSGIGLPVDFWMPASSQVRPQTAHSVTAGIFHAPGDGMFEYSAELYYKKLSGQLEFDGNFFDMVNREYIVGDHLLSGTGQNYGAEFMFKKNYGRVTGWVSYTLGWATRSFPEIAGGRPFPSKHDRRHNLSVVATYCPVSRLELSAVFVYASGLPFTMPVSVYIVGENVLSEYGDRNGSRMPDYHRLDFSATWHLRQKGRCRHSFNLSLYNVYARNNPIFMDVKVNYDEHDNTVELSPEGISFYRLLPSLGYVFKF